MKTWVSALQRFTTPPIGIASLTTTYMLINCMPGNPANLIYDKTRPLTPSSRKFNHQELIIN